MAQEVDLDAATTRTLVRIVRALTRLIGSNPTRVDWYTKTTTTICIEWGFNYRLLVGVPLRVSLASVRKALKLPRGR